MASNVPRSGRRKEHRHTFQLAFAADAAHWDARFDLSLGGFQNFFSHSRWKETRRDRVDSYASPRPLRGKLAGHRDQPALRRNVTDYVLAAFHPQLWLIIPIGLIFSVSYGAYQAVDWALALRVLPGGGDAGKDMGIWHISMVLPQIIGPAMSGWIISGLSLAVSTRFAYLFAFCLAAACFFLAAWLIRKVRLPAPA